MSIEQDEPFGRRNFPVTPVREKTAEEKRADELQLLRTINPWGLKNQVIAKREEMIESVLATGKLTPAGLLLDETARQRSLAELRLTISLAQQVLQEKGIS